MFPVRWMISLVSCLVLAIAAPAWSQQPDRLAMTKRYVIATAGAALNPETTATFAGEYGEKVSDTVMAFVNYAYYDNLMSDGMRSNLTLASAVLTQATGNVRTFSGRDRGLAFTAGAKFTVPAGTRFRPYVGAGAGALHLRRTITEVALGDVTASFAAQSGLGDGVIPGGTTASMKPLVEAIAGVHAVSGRTFMDVSFRYRRAFRAQSLSLSQFGVGVGVAF